jgi:hypothetical protein
MLYFAAYLAGMATMFLLFLVYSLCAAAKSGDAMAEWEEYHYREDDEAA